MQVFLLSKKWRRIRDCCFPSFGGKDKKIRLVVVHSPKPGEEQESKIVISDGLEGNVEKFL